MTGTRIALFGCVLAAFAGCRTRVAEPEAPTPKPLVSVTPRKYRGEMIQEQKFGQARIAVGMTKKEVLEQIELSRKQYEPLFSWNSYEMFVQTPSAETVRTETWVLICPCRVRVGGGSGIMLRLKFRDGKVVSIERLPWIMG